MKKLTYFYLPNCPHCRIANRCIEELCAEDECFSGVEIERVDESAEKARAAKYDYWYVPCFFLGTEKLHEGHAEKADVKAVLQRALSD
jgi:glutaredoxin